jgi:hypothetical protein
VGVVYPRDGSTLGVSVRYILWLSNGKPITIYDVRAMDTQAFHHFADTEPDAFERYCKLDIENALRRWSEPLT